MAGNNTHQVVTLSYGLNSTVYTYVVLKVAKSVDNYNATSQLCGNLATAWWQLVKSIKGNPSTHGRLTCPRKQPQEKQTDELAVDNHTHMHGLFINVRSH